MELPGPFMFSRFSRSEIGCGYKNHPEPGSVCWIPTLAGHDERMEEWIIQNSKTRFVIDIESVFLRIYLPMQKSVATR